MSLPAKLLSLPDAGACCRLQATAASHQMHVQVVDSLRKGHQAMVFVHSRKDTGKTARTLVTKAQNAGDGAVFDCSDQDAYPYMAKDVKRSRNKCATTF